MKQLKTDFSKNFLKLNFSTELHRFDFYNASLRKNFIQRLNEDVFKNKETKINCNENTFSARDRASVKFIESDFYMDMLDSIGFSKNEDIIKNMRGFKKIDINYDMFCGGDRLLEQRVKHYPSEFVNEETPVCYIFHPSFRDEKYQYDLYVKINIRNNNINVMSLHWGDNCFKERPQRVWNYKDNCWDNIEKVEKFLEHKTNDQKYER